LALALGENSSPEKRGGMFDKAAAYFKESAQSQDDLQRASAIYYMASGLVQQGKTEDAKATIKGLLSAPVSSPELGRFKNLALVLDARCDNQLGNSQESLETLNKMAQREDNTDQLLFAKINNARGECYLKLNQPQRAAYSFLQTDLLFFSDPESHAESLFHLRSVLASVGEPAKAAQAGQRLTKQYASSVWANKK
jgi:tetratricopeptide (TPR) repeat protein